MEVKDFMSNQVVTVHPGESVEIAARTMTQYNIGALPVCSNGKLCGMLTDRDIVTRCLAAGKAPQSTSVKEIMSTRLYVGRPDMEVSVAAGLMGKEQIRRLPVMENGKLCGMVSLGDLARKEESCMDAGGALTEISCHLSSRE